MPRIPLRRQRPRPEPPPAGPPLGPFVLPDHVLDDLELAGAQAIGGDPPSPQVTLRLELALAEVLDRHGLRGARIDVQPGHGGIRAVLRFPPGPIRVKEAVLTFD